MKICIERTDRMGDMILTLPVIQGIKEKNPQAIVHVIASQKNSKICNQFNLIEKIFEKSKLSSSFNNLTKSISAEKYDYYFTFSPGWFGLCLGFFSKSKFKSSLILKSRYSSNVLSKLGQIFFSKVFYSLSFVINRFELLKANKDIHQTNMMMDVVSKSGIAISRKTQTKFIFNNEFTLNKSKPVCIVHLSSKWVNSYYSEENFDDLIKLLNEKDILIYLTTDETTKNKFNKIFETFDAVEDPSKMQKSSKSILICNNFKFANWTSLINQADYVITPESGCTHIASLTKCKLAVIYDANNSPNSIRQEYAPWNKEYLALETNDKDLNQKLFNFI
ncbi:glycosyltransferase family 9 protein [Pelagibacterales bacterium SAG-MED31]|nr:glycosyltransferase family 9 protein [Pelagibacterales bacterium SAG-MED31]